MASQTVNSNSLAVNITNIKLDSLSLLVSGILTKLPETSILSQYLNKGCFEDSCIMLKFHYIEINNSDPINA